MKERVLSILLCLFFVSACNQTPQDAGGQTGPSEAQRYAEAEYQRQVEVFNEQAARTNGHLDMMDARMAKAEEQANRSDAQLDETDKQLARSNEQADRFEALLKRWEEQADRQDAILGAVEKILEKAAKPE